MELSEGELGVWRVFDSSCNEYIHLGIVTLGGVSSISLFQLICCRCGAIDEILRYSLHGVPIYIQSRPGCFSGSDIQIYAWPVGVFTKHMLYIYIYMCWMLRVCNEKCQTYPGRLWLWGSTYLFFLDNQNHDWAAKLNAVSFSCKHGSVIWLFCTSLRFFLIKSRLWVVLHNTQTFCLTLLPLCQWICGLPFENRLSFRMHVVPLPGRSKFWMCINRCYPWQGVLLFEYAWTMMWHWKIGS